jgi:hypothetical protein
VIAQYCENHPGDKDLSLLANIRQQQQTWARRALGLFVAVWLNLALQPCAMALESMQDNDCAHCPPAQMHEHDGMHESMGHEMPCAGAAADCSFSEDLNHDERGGQLKLKDAQLDSPIAISSREFVLPYGNPVDFRPRPRYASVHSGAPPPLNVLHCVYLK